MSKAERLAQKMANKANGNLLTKGISAPACTPELFLPAAEIIVKAEKDIRANTEALKAANARINELSANLEALASLPDPKSDYFRGYAPAPVPSTDEMARSYSPRQAAMVGMPRFEEIIRQGMPEMVGENA